ncbi:DUF7383 domain-containing protein [Haloglomus salinum]|uniref:DUF7383 domain-containing protein n=1 Tax=Haloglomus salinum TaxID=2962673 RepID=UPI0020C948BB|nr:hypothetical protein [Haloglomus salinum]
MTRRANYALVNFMELLGEDADDLDTPWAEFVGDRTEAHAFEIPADDPTEGFVQLQAYDVSEFGHEIVVNGEPLSGFDIPPAPGWQCWMDSITGTDLVGGENTLRIRRDAATDDAFVIGTATVHWKEPVE